MWKCCPIFSCSDTPSKLRHFFIGLWMVKSLLTKPTKTPKDPSCKSADFKQIMHQVGHLVLIQWYDMYVTAILHVSWWQLWQWLSMIMMMGKNSHSLQASTHAFNLLAVTPRGEALACKPRLGQLSEIWELGNFCLMITLQVNCSNTNKNPHHANQQLISYKFCSLPVDYIRKLVGNGAIFLTLEPYFGWGNCLSLTRMSYNWLVCGS